MMIWHGSTAVVEKPDVSHSYRALDFGKGFYVTSVREQAIRWAKRKAFLTRSDKAVLNSYELAESFYGFTVKRFDDDLSEWIDFVCACRKGESVYTEYDIIIGKVADDRVFRVVDLYRSGVWDKERAIREMMAYENYDQIAFISQTALDTLLSFKGFEEV